MKELERWWRWFDNEKPGLERALKLLHELLSDTEKDALRCAAGFVACRQDGVLLSFVTAAGDIHQLRHVMATDPAALRDMSLELCRSFERMEVQVPRTPAVKDERPEWWKKTQPRVSDDTLDALGYALKAERTLAEQKALFTERFLQKRYTNSFLTPDRGYLGGGYFVRASASYAPHRVMSVDLSFEEVPK